MAETRKLWRSFDKERSAARDTYIPGQVLGVKSQNICNSQSWKLPRGPLPGVGAAKPKKFKISLAPNPTSISVARHETKVRTSHDHIRRLN
jgi:hypothetical protein